MVYLQPEKRNKAPNRKLRPILFSFGIVILSSISISCSWGEKSAITILFISLFPLLVAETLLGRSATLFRVSIVFIFFIFLHLFEALLNDLSFKTLVKIYLANSFLINIPWTFYVVTKDKYGYFAALSLLIPYWLSFEYFHSHWIMSCPWYNFGNSLSGLPSLIQWYEYTGVEGGSLWILGSNILTFSIFIAIKSNRHPYKILSVATLLCIWVVTPILISNRINFNHVGASQQVLSLSTNESHSNYKQITYRELLNATLEEISDSIKIIIWPENSISKIISSKTIMDTTAFNEIRKDVLKKKRSWIIGSVLKADIQTYFNGALLFSPEKQLPFYYAKSMLVPFAEFIPFPEDSKNLSLFIPEVTNILFSVKDEKQSMPTGFCVAICFEELFGELIAKTCYENPGLIFVLSNEEWTKNASKQFAQIGALRAIETRKFVIRSTNQGIPSIINPLGSFEKFSVDTSLIASLIARVTPNTYKTFYMKHGDYIGKLAILLLLLSIFIHVIYSLTKRYKFPYRKE